MITYAQKCFDLKVGSNFSTTDVVMEEVINISPSGQSVFAHADNCKALLQQVTEILRWYNFKKLICAPEITESLGGGGGDGKEKADFIALNLFVQVKLKFWR